MQIITAILVGVPVLALFVWMLVTSKSGGDKEELIDPSDSRQIGLLVGLMGGTIPDAAVVRFALQRFEEIHGRKATTRDAGIVAGLIKTMK